jgi:hypothetical protein
LFFFILPLNNVFFFWTKKIIIYKICSSWLRRFNCLSLILLNIVFYSSNVAHFCQIWCNGLRVSLAHLYVCIKLVKHRCFEPKCSLAREEKNAYHGCRSPFRSFLCSQIYVKKSYYMSFFHENICYLPSILLEQCYP